MKKGPVDRLQAAARFVVGLSGGLRRGDFFPAAGRLRPARAPGGTREERSGGPLGTRLRDEVGWFTETRHTLPVPGLARPVELLQLTDAHVRGESPWLDRLCARLASLPPTDVLVLTGDMMTLGWTERAVERFLSSLPPARLGRYAIMGNWEYWAGAPPRLWGPRLAGHGVHLLVDEVVEVGPLVLAGTDDQVAGHPDAPALRARLPTGRPVVVLTHCPAFAPALAGPDVPLILSGHSHGGQVRLPLVGAAWVPGGTGTYVAGWYELGGSHLFVSRGIGWSIAPVRLACPPELARIRLVPG